MSQVTVLTPVSPDHLDRLPLAQAAVAVQTVPVTHLHRVDVDRRGPGWTRNRLLEQVTTEYVTFLDADDWMAPTFAARTLAAIRPGRYVYTDWWQTLDTVVRVPPKPWCRGSFHLITALVRTADARAVGGFDETLAGMEDTDFYLKLMQRGICGWHLKAPLVGYRPGGGRAQTLHESGGIDAIRAVINERYGRHPMGCCGDNQETIHNPPAGERQPGDVLAQALWGGNRVEQGRATGRHYPRTSYPKLAWVDPRDVQAAPHLWQVVPADEPGNNGHPPPFDAGGVAALAEKLTDLGVFRPAPPRPPLRRGAEPVQAAPAVRTVRRLVGAVTVPTFVRPRQDFPSFRDLWRLADLAGFPVRYLDEVDPDDPSLTLIFSTPADLPDLRQARARTIFWDLEYAGGYTDHVNQETVDEVWSSEPTHARETGARYVLLGSHRGLCPERDRLEMAYDLTLLGYLTPRRQAVKERLADRAWTPDYPGHADSPERHQVLRSTRLMLHVHQHDLPRLAPLRLAIGAAYRLPIICEDVPDRGLYGDGVLFARYDSLPQMARLMLEGKLGGDWQELGVSPVDRLHALLCDQYPFGATVMAALGEGVLA